MDRMLDATAASEDRHFWFLGLRRQARLLLKAGLAGRRPRLIVDCGAGTGRNLEWLSAFGPSVGVELSPTGLKYGRARGRRLVCGTVTQLPFADASADATTSFDVLYMLDDQAERQAVREMWRILAPGGVAVINAAALDMLKGAHSTLTRERRRYTRRRLRTLMEESGFRVERMTFTNFTPLPAALLRRTFERATGRDQQESTADLRVPPAPINALFAGALRLEGAWLRFANLPIGTSLLTLVRKPNAKFQPVTSDL